MYIRNVLYVENNSQHKDMVEKIFRRLYDFHVNFSRSSKEALDMVTSQNYDVVITDIGLFNMDGTMLARKIKEVKPNQIIIANSGHSEIDLELFDGNWPKPIQINKLESEFKRLGLIFGRIK